MQFGHVGIALAIASLDPRQPWALLLESLVFAVVVWRYAGWIV